MTEKRQVGNDAFTRWIPVEGCDAVYDVEDVCISADGLTVTMIPDDLDRKKRGSRKIKLTWPRFCAYQVSQETYREDLWIKDPQAAWTFYRSKASSLLEQFKRGSVLFSKNTVHFLLVGTNLIVDVLAEEPHIIVE